MRNSVVRLDRDDRDDREDLGALRKVAGIAQDVGAEPECWQRAREIMGTNFFGPDDASTHFGVTPSKAQLEALSEIPFTEEELIEKRQSHILAACFPLSVSDIRRRVRSEMFCEDLWYDEELFANRRGSTCWQLVRKSPVESSISKSWDEQRALLAKQEYSPLASVLIYIIIGHFLKTGECLFPGLYVRCQDVDSHGGGVYLGNFGSEGLDIYEDGADFAYDFLGLASAWKSAQTSQWLR